jgi:phosphoglycerol transferase
MTQVLLAGTCVLIFLTVRNCGLFPSIFDDEWIYSEYSRLAPRSDAPVPSYLFFLLFGTTRFFGEGFLECARIYNACFFAVALVFIYGVCRIYSSHKLALFTAILSVLGPINTYSAYFMPESMYFCAFWMMSWFLLRGIEKGPWILGAGSGAILGLMAMIKFHAVFLLPGFAAFVFLAWITKAAHLTARSVIQTLLLTGLAFIAVRFAGGYLLAGQAGLQLAGERYGSFASPSSSPAHGSHILALSATRSSVIY